MAGASADDEFCEVSVEEAAAVFEGSIYVDVRCVQGMMRARAAYTRGS